MVNSYENLTEQSSENNQEIPMNGKSSKKFKTIAVAVLVSLVIAVIAGFIAYDAISKNMRYESAKSDLDNGSYQDAIYAFTNLGDYRSSPVMLELSRIGMYNKALDYIAEKEYDDAIDLLGELDGYGDSKAIIQQLYSENNNIDAINGNKNMTKDYAESAIKVLEEHKYRKAEGLVDQLHMFVLVGKSEWEYVSGDATVCSAFSDSPFECKTITTEISPENWYMRAFSVHVKYQKKELLEIGGYNHSTRGYDKETDSAYFTGSSKSFSGQASVTVENTDTLKITIEYKDGTKSECTYKRVK